MTITAERLGHRGTPAFENTIRGLEACLDAGLDGAEIDLMTTADGEVVLFHDVNLRRRAGDHRLVARTSWSELSQVQLVDGERIPRLVDVLDMWPTGKCLDLEFKPGGTGLVEKVLALTRGRSDIVLSSFDPTLLLAAGSVHPRALILALGSSPALRSDGGRELGCEFVHLEATMVTEERVRVYVARGLRVGIWGARSTDHERDAVSFGVERVITDFV